jgi:RNA polymerase sigma-70 factor (ECF subfamily)
VHALKPISQPSAHAPLADFAEFYRHFERLVRSIVYPLVGAADSDDVVQSAFLKCWERRGDLRDPAAVRSWVATVAINQARDHWRRRKPWAPLPELEAPVADGPRRQTHQALILAALQHLDFDLREVIVLRYFQEKSLGEVAVVLGIAEGTVKSRLHHAKAKLKPWLIKAGVLDA